MRKWNWKKFGMAAGLALTLAAAGCGADDSADKNADGETDYSKAVDYQVTGIEPGAGVVKASEKAIEEYDNMKGWEVETSSSGAMATALGEAIKKKDPIVITGWSPHWMFAKYDLKYLDDPKGVFGKAETINTMTRKGLKDDMPNAYKVLDNFKWSKDDIEEVMLDIQDGKDPEEAAQKWIDKNKDTVDKWTKGVEKSNGEKVKLVYVEWDTEIASTNVIGKVLEDLGFKVNITPLDNAVMWKAVADGEADGMVAAWLPATHGDLYEQYKDDVDNLGENLEGAKIGLVVPKYMDIDSIEDLKQK
ncbi:glycine betaine ABC transporter substrate-binding protein [Virgibacillus halophilus]|uniref:Glycine betaine ABC transporter substrate-binding protein n=1 Tax=Tigheibacillus halophilus TaxID=361280 RepID=A0ABU5C9X7_9BACI|nr:glycine betaine ABC transporter substrate-binding protein [Virgibacillus halophilus]